MSLSVSVSVLAQSLSLSLYIIKTCTHIHSPPAHHIYIYVCVCVCVRLCVCVCIYVSPNLYSQTPLYQTINNKDVTSICLSVCLSLFPTLTHIHIHTHTHTHTHTYIQNRVIIYLHNNKLLDFTSLFHHIFIVCAVIPRQIAKEISRSLSCTTQYVKLFRIFFVLLDSNWVKLTSNVLRCISI